MSMPPAKFKTVERPTVCAVSMPKDMATDSTLGVNVVEVIVPAGPKFVIEAPEAKLTEGDALFLEYFRFALTVVLNL